MKPIFAVVIAGALFGAVGGLALYFLKKAPVVGPFVSKLSA